MKKIIIGGNIVALSEKIGIEITDEEAVEIKTKADSRPKAPEGYGYHLKEDLTYELYELPSPEAEPFDEEATAYTAEQLEQMTSTELREICSEMGISGTMTKANMISLILGKQNEVIE